MPDQQAKGQNTLMAVLCYFGILVLIPILSTAKNDPYVKFHIKQGLALLLVYIIVGLFFRIVFIGWILDIILFILFLMGVINAATGKQKPLPIIGSFAEKLNF